MDERDLSNNKDRSASSEEIISVPNPPGRKTYETYLTIFGTTFAPRWNDLSDISKENWNKFTIALKNES